MTASSPAHDAAAGGRWVALSGGVGGVKLALGLARVLAGRLTVIVNTGDDFVHLGLHVSPDVDTTLYTLADLVDPVRGWGRKDETWRFMAALGDLGGATWFNLGDGDLALHVERTRRLTRGESLSEITEAMACRLGIAARIVPMSDQPVRTMVETDAGRLEFQHYFVREQCRPVIRAIEMVGAAAARPSPAASAALSAPDLAGIVICPSNPFLSIDPILAISGMREALSSAGVPIVAVCPIVDGMAIKGPTAKIMTELGLEASVAAVVAHYGDLVDCWVVDTSDRDLAASIGADAVVAPTVMRSLEDKIALAEVCVRVGGELAGRTSQ